MTSFRELLAEHGDAEGIAAALRLSKAQREALMPLIADEVRRLERSDTRSVESSTPRTGGRLPVDRCALMRRSFALPDGSFVRWGQATVEDHQARIGMLAKLRNGLDATIGRHAVAVEQILAADVTCLDEISDAEEDAA